MKLQPMNDKLIVKRDKPKEKSPGGIILPDSSKIAARSGKVLAVGRGKVTEKGSILPMSIKVNDTVLFSAYSGNEVDFENDKLLILSESEVLATMA